MFITPHTEDATIAYRYREWADGQARRWGHEPNYAALFSTRPDIADAWTVLNVALRDSMNRRRFASADAQVPGRQDVSTRNVTS